jgi:hypothetical protein
MIVLEIFHQTRQEGKEGSPDVAALALALFHHSLVHQPKSTEVPSLERTCDAKKFIYFLLQAFPHLASGVKELKVPVGADPNLFGLLNSLRVRPFPPLKLQQLLEEIISIDEQLLLEHESNLDQFVSTGVWYLDSHLESVLFSWVRWITSFFPVRHPLTHTTHAHRYRECLNR